MIKFQGNNQFDFDYLLFLVGYRNLSLTIFSYLKNKLNPLVGKRQQNKRRKITIRFIEQIELLVKSSSSPSPLLFHIIIC